ncbi:MAG: adenylosuccinate synthetase [Chloroflexales bacterium]|nr:adenylosuccinate synthetase [Chloroflexales bacterium]
MRYALELAGSLDYLTVTCLDRLAELPALQVCRRYSFDTFVVERIARSPTSRSLAHQEQIMRNLARCRPLFEPVANPSALLELLNGELGTPVRFVSEGPSAADKRWLDISRDHETGVYPSL